MSKTFSEKILRKSTKISMSVFPRLFLFCRVFRCFLAMGVQNTQQKTFDKKIVSKTFYKTIDKKIPNRFFLDFLLSRFWAFLGEGSSKTR
jgi:hypothetical protein